MPDLVDLNATAIADRTLLSETGSVPAVSGLSAKESGVAAFRRTQIILDDVACALTDEAGVVAYVGKKLYDFPAANVVILSSVADLALTKSSAGVNADWDGDFGVGTVTASNNGTLASTEQNIIPTTATPQAVSGATTAEGINTAAVFLDGTATAPDLYLNILVDDADHNVTGTACNIIANGTITIVWVHGGDIA